MPHACPFIIIVGYPTAYNESQPYQKGKEKKKSNIILGSRDYFESVDPLLVI